MVLKHWCVSLDDDAGTLLSSLPMVHQVLRDAADTPHAAVAQRVVHVILRRDEAGKAGKSKSGIAALEGRAARLRATTVRADATRRILVVEFDAIEPRDLARWSRTTVLMGCVAAAPTVRTGHIVDFSAMFEPGAASVDELATTAWWDIAGHELDVAGVVRCVEL